MIRATTTPVLAAALAATAALTIAAAASAAPGKFGPLPPPNPAAGPVGTAFQHGDSEASDSTPFAGPGAGAVRSTFAPLGANCASILMGSDGVVQALCSSNADQSPVVQLLDPGTGASLASLALPKGGLFSGVYGYLDNANRMVAVDGRKNLVRIGHDRGGPNGSWRLFTAESTSIASAAEKFCGTPGCDNVVAPTPDHSGKVWFATSRATVGVVDTATGVASSILLGAGEGVANSIASAPEGMSVATTHALYLLRIDDSGTPQVVWRKEYDRGPGRKPGQLSHGTGATPTFFGPRTGTEYIAITDNAAPQENLLVHRTADGSTVCSTPVVAGTENSPIGSGNSVFVASTFGYPYPVDLGPSVPPTADFTGGMVRVDVAADGSGCATKWTNEVRSAAVPKLSLADGGIYTIARRSPGGQPGPDDTYEYTVTDAQTGHVRRAQQIGQGAGQNTLQLAGNIMPDGTLLQGAVAGVHRIASVGGQGPGSSSGGSAN
ncbi:hypothetical protein GCM10023094_43510 [Rhodococcus olei]|uniref:6-phosphogluconolactonase (Cycloisomerase 2 family) n=1 Tax=Rhodococcus olei TaxID=2161675 RepID=A0ABP8PEP5_9NOCA